MVTINPPPIEFGAKFEKTFEINISGFPLGLKIGFSIDVSISIPMVLDTKGKQAMIL